MPGNADKECDTGAKNPKGDGVKDPKGDGVKNPKGDGVKDPKVTAAEARPAQRNAGTEATDYNSTPTPPGFDAPLGFSLSRQQYELLCAARCASRGIDTVTRPCRGAMGRGRGRAIFRDDIKMPASAAARLDLIGAMGRGRGPVIFRDDIQIPAIAAARLDVMPPATALALPEVQVVVQKTKLLTLSQSPPTRPVTEKPALICPPRTDIGSRQNPRPDPPAGARLYQPKDHPADTTVTTTKPRATPRPTVSFDDFHTPVQEYVPPGHGEHDGPVPDGWHRHYYAEHAMRCLSFGRGPWVQYPRHAPPLRLMIDPDFWAQSQVQSLLPPTGYVVSDSLAHGVRVFVRYAVQQTDFQQSQRSSNRPI
jgi:hypothetical protein